MARGHGRWHFLARSERFPGAAGARPWPWPPSPGWCRPDVVSLDKGSRGPQPGSGGGTLPALLRCDRCESRCEVGPPASAASGASGRLGGAKPRAGASRGRVPPVEKSSPASVCPPPAWNRGGARPVGARFGLPLSQDRGRGAFFRSSFLNRSMRLFGSRRKGPPAGRLFRGSLCNGEATAVSGALAGRSPFQFASRRRRGVAAPAAGGASLPFRAV